MKQTFLEFEQPIAELQQKIDELRFVHEDSAVDIADEIARLTKKSQQLTKDGSPSSRLQRARKLLAVRLPEAHPDVRDAAKYELKLHESAGESGGSMLTIELASRADGMILASESGTIDRDGNGYEALINRFQSSAFHHRRDPQAEPVPRLELFDDILLENK